MNFIQLSLESEQMSSTWTGTLKQFGRNTCIVPSSQYTYLLFTDGRLMGMFNFGQRIYPFSEDPLKKPSFFQRKKIRQAEVVCISNGFKFCLNWGTSYMKIDDKTNQFYDVSMSGRLYVEIGQLLDQVLAFYQRVVLNGPSVIEKEYFWNKIKPIILSYVPELFDQFLAEKNISLEKCIDMTPSEIMYMSQWMCKKVRDELSLLGISISPAFESVFLNIVSIKNR